MKTRNTNNNDDDAGYDTHLLMYIILIGNTDSYQLVQPVKSKLFSSNYMEGFRLIVNNLK